MKTSKILVREVHKQLPEKERKKLIIDNIVELLLLEYQNLDLKNQKLDEGSDCLCYHDNRQSVEPFMEVQSGDYSKCSNLL